VEVSDDKCSPLSAPVEISGNGDAVFDAGEVWEYTCSMDVSEDVMNTATVTGTDELAGTVVDTAQASVDVIHPAIEADKQADPTVVEPGDMITFTVAISNTGDVVLEDIAVVDTLCVLSAPEGDDGDGLLQVGEEWVYTCTMVAGSERITNTVVCTGTDALGGQVTAEATVIVRQKMPYRYILPFVARNAPMETSDTHALTHSAAAAEETGSASSPPSVRSAPFAAVLPAEESYVRRRTTYRQPRDD
jgi:uncharacterized repeat protein (TIGR01451 family)